MTEMQMVLLVLQREQFIYRIYVRVWFLDILIIIKIDSLIQFYL